MLSLYKSNPLALHKAQMKGIITNRKAARFPLNVFNKKTYFYVTYSPKCQINAQRQISR